MNDLDSRQPPRDFRTRLLLNPSDSATLCAGLADFGNPYRWWRRYLISSGIKTALLPGITAKLMIDAPNWGSALLIELAARPDDTDSRDLALKAAFLTEIFSGGEKAESCRRIAAFLIHQELMDHFSGAAPASEFLALRHRALGDAVRQFVNFQSISFLVPVLAFSLLHGRLLDTLWSCAIPAKVRLDNLARLASWVAWAVDRPFAELGRKSHLQSDLRYAINQGLYEAIIAALVAKAGFDDLYGPQETIEAPRVQMLGQKIAWLFSVSESQGNRAAANLCKVFFDTIRRDGRTLIEFYCKCLFVAAVSRNQRGLMGGTLIADELDVAPFRLEAPAFEGYDASICYPVRVDGGAEIASWQPFGRIDYVKDLRSEMEPVSVFRFEDCQVYPSGRVVVAKTNVLPRELHGVATTTPQLDMNARDRQRHPDLLIQRDGVVALKHMPAGEHVETGILFCGYSYADNFGHFIYHGLPKVFARARVAGAEQTTVILPGKPAPFHAPVFRYLGIADEEVRYVDSHPISVGTLYVVQEPPLGLLHFSAWAAIQSMALPVPETGTHNKKIYLSRAKTGRRRVANEDSVVALLSAEGFEIVHPDDHTFEEQMQILNSAELIVAPHGSALSPLVLCPPRHRRIIEFFSKPVSDRTAPIFWFHGCDHYTIHSSNPDQSDEDDYHVDVAVLRKLLSLVEMESAA